MAGNLMAYDTPAGIDLGAVDMLDEAQVRLCRLDLSNGWFDGILVRRGDRVFGYLDRCPHAGVRLGRQPDTYLGADGDELTCSWHGARFAIATGRCTGGPCGGQRLSPWPVEVIDGRIVTV